MEAELNLLLQLEELIRQNQDQLLMEIVPADCKCQGKTKKVFRCPGAFDINILLTKLTQARIAKIGA